MRWVIRDDKDNKTGSDDGGSEMSGLEEVAVASRSVSDKC